LPDPCVCQITPILAVAPGRLASTVLATALLYGVELVIAGDDLERAAALVAEDVKSRIRATGWRGRANTPSISTHFRRALGGHILAIGGAPRHEAFQIGGQRADARFHAVGRDQHGIGAKGDGICAL
jgi:hypothetical protein